MKLTVHVILNSHLGSVWRWTLPQGVDEALNTARTNFDILDEYPEVVITRSDAWFIADAARRMAIHHPPAKEQQVVFVNMSKTDFEGFIDFEP
ncbi:MAG: hypothetical protein NTW86_19245, partial [Candidatus Sumerlaeota bacterium]|nr:hypothetical protein [Candidatus Sumerlaeota bacterium]